MNAQYVKDLAGNNSAIRIEFDGVTSSVPLDPANADYVAIMELVEAGKLTIEPAE